MNTLINFLRRVHHTLLGRNRMLINTYYRMGNEIIVLDDANVRWPVSNMIDRFGEETDDAREAVCVVIKLSENMWLPVHLSNLEHRTIN